MNKSLDLKQSKSETNGASSSAEYHKASSVGELTRKNIETIHRLEAAAKEKQTASQRIAKLIADFCGSMIFVWVHVVWFGVWILLNTLPGITHFDEFPFTFLTLVVSLEAIFLSTFILISQNQETRLTERNNQLDLQINLLTEQENTKILKMLERISEKLEIEIDDDPSVRVLEEATRPEELIEQIEQINDQKASG